MATCGGKADLVFHGGEVLAAEGDPLAAPVPGGGFRVRDCLGVRDGRVVFPEGRGGWRELAGPATETVDLRGSAVLPGIVDAHLHPLWGARTLAGASLGYEPLSMEGTIGRLRDLLARDAGACPDGLLLVRCWQRHGGADLTAADLDALETRRPVLLLSGDCHTVCLNRRAMEVFRDFLAGADPPDGRILRDGAGRPGGLVEDGPAFRLYDHASRQEAREAAETLRRGLAALNRQGVTSVMDARATPEALEAADLLWEEDALTVRLSGAWELTPDRCPSPGDAERAVREAAEAMRGYRRGPDAGAGAWPDARVRPGVSLRHLKFFVDGMPGNATARLRSPYLAAPGPSGRPAPLPPAPRG
ncbi:MAG: amidohydrolase family protein, partial [Deltaproteobacteria bacterium]|nr:amidohydrolase family protein [Deltaproteobacteria bacterium]